MDEFTTVFLFINNSEEVFRDSFRTMGFGAFAIVTGIALLAWNLFAKQRITLREKTSRSFVTAIWILAGIGVFANGLKDRTMFEQRYQSILDMYNNQQYKIVEGPIHVIREESASGHDSGDIVEVADTQLEISHFVVSFGYKDTIAYNGVLREGAYARVYYIEDDWLNSDMILRIDLRNK